MDKQDNGISNYSHGLSLFERKNLVITGVKKIENFDKLHFLLDTTMGFLIIKGNDLELIKLDTLSGNLTIKGNIDSLDYILENKKNNKEESLLSRLFK
jgi:sporulation protein YabP